ncbi:hypothetical protein QYF36_023068 [Acer negundo]|nr:hypothetical protein QYF36_023068 [Acer negundo]
MTKGWTAKVLIAEKTMPRESQHSSNIYQRFILIDSEGTRVQASIFGVDIKLFEDTSTISKIYHISNAYVKPIRPEHRIVENDLQWTINGRTLIKEVEDDQVIVPAAFSFVPFADLEKYKDCLAQVDLFSSDSEVKALVKELTPLLPLCITINNIQPVLSGVADGAGWQGVVAYVNIACYYLFGIPLGLILGFKVG